MLSDSIYNHWYTAWYKRPYVEAYIVAYNLNIVFLRFLLWIGLLVELRWVTCSTVLEKGFELQVDCWSMTQYSVTVGIRIQSVRVYKYSNVVFPLPAFRSRKTTSISSTEFSFYTHDINFKHQVII